MLICKIENLQKPFLFRNLRVFLRVWVYIYVKVAQNPRSCLFFVTPWTIIFPHSLNFHRTWVTISFLHTYKYIFTSLIHSPTFIELLICFPYLDNYILYILGIQDINIFFYFSVFAFLSILWVFGVAKWPRPNQQQCAAFSSELC